MWIFNQTFGHVGGKTLLMVFSSSAMSPDRCRLKSGYEQVISENRRPPFFNMNCKQMHQLEEPDLYSLLTFQCLEKESFFGPIHFQNTQKGLRYPPGFRPDLEARGPPADLVDLDRGHRETAILPACIRRQLPFVGNV